MKEGKWRGLIAALVVICFMGANVARAGHAKQDVIKLGQVVVTATRTETDVDSAPGSVTVITDKDLKKFRIHTVDEAIKYEAGVFARHTKGLANSMPKVQLRGLYGQYRTLVLLNGVPLNAGYNGLVDWNTINTENVERIEVIRGPASALYGGNAMGGVINIITKTPKKFYGNVRSGYGSDDTCRYSINLGDRFKDKLSLGLGFEREETDGYPSGIVTRSIKSGAGTLTGGWETTSISGTPKWVVGDTGDNKGKRWNFHLETRYDLTETGNIAFNFQKGFHRYDYDRPHTYLRDQNGNPAYSGYVDCGGGRRAKVSPYNYLAGMGEKEDSNYSLAYKEIFGPVAFNGKVGYQDRDNWYTTRSGYSGTYDDASGKLKDANSKSWFTDLQSNTPLGENHLLTFGLYFRYDNYEDREYGLSFYRDEGSKTAETGLTEGKDRFYAVYVQDEWKIIDKLTLFTGIRFDYWKAFDGKSGNIGSVQKFSEPNDSALSPKASLVFTPFDNTIVKGSAGRAFRAPTIYDLYKTWTSSWGTVYHSNPDLDPETLWNYEIDLDQYLFSRKIKLSAAFFHTDIDDLIYTYYEGKNQYRNNAGKAKINGIELGISVKPVDWLRVWGNYTYNDSEIKKHDYKPEVEGKKIANMPVTTANLGAEVTYRWITASLAGQYLGKIYKSELNDDVHDVYTGYTQKYWLWNTKLTVAPVRNFEVSFSVDNLFDKKYYDYYVGDDRTYFVEACLRW